MPLFNTIMKNNIVFIVLLVFISPLISASNNGLVSDLGVNISTNSSTFFGGQRSIVTTTVTNTGPDVASNVQLQIILSSPVELSTLAINSQLDCQMNMTTVNCTLAS